MTIQDMLDDGEYEAETVTCSDCKTVVFYYKAVQCREECGRMLCSYCSQYGLCGECSIVAEDEDE
jgi:uncharacterized protein CbrC (UPF0167 family)